MINSSGDSARARPDFEAAFASASDSRLEFLAIDALHMLAIVVPLGERDVFNERALGMADSAVDPRARQWRASLLNNMGWTAFDRGDYLSALRLFQDALAARVEQGKQPEILVARWCVARCLRQIGRVEEALAIQLELAESHRSAGTSDPYVDEEIAACRAALDEHDAASG